MAKLLQFRCPKCLGLLFKVEEGKITLEYKDPGLQYYRSESGKEIIVECTKCFTISEVTPHGLVQFNKASPQNAGVSLPVL